MRSCSRSSYYINDRKKPMRTIFYLGLAFWAATAGPIRAQLTVAAAADLQYALPEILQSFKVETGIETKAVFGSTGKLAAQIRSGAPFDLFLAANLAYPESLCVRGLAVAPPRKYAYGILVLWTTRDADLSAGFSSLLNPSIGKIAIPDPRHAPYGMAAEAGLRAAGILDSVKSKFIFGDNITQTAQFISSGSVEAGFNSKAIVLSPPLIGKGRWIEMPRNSYPEIAQAMVITKYGQDHHPALAGNLRDYLTEDGARAVLARYGFLLPPKPAP